MSVGFRCVFKQDRPAPFARYDHVEITVTIDVQHRDAQARSDLFAAGNDMLCPADGSTPIEFVPVYTQGSACVGIVAVVGKESLARKEVQIAIVVQISQR
jgi:hypothetical protein